MSAAQLRHLLHHLAIKHFTVGVFVALDTVAAPSAPLFEEEGGSGMTGTWYVSYPASFFFVCLTIKIDNRGYRYSF
jgi:hypothetical protein